MSTPYTVTASPATGFKFQYSCWTVHCAPPGFIASFESLMSLVSGLCDNGVLLETYHVFFNVELTIHCCFKQPKGQIHTAGRHCSRKSLNHHEPLCPCDSVWTDKCWTLWSLGVALGSKRQWGKSRNKQFYWTSYNNVWRKKKLILLRFKMIQLEFLVSTESY